MANGKAVKAKVKKLEAELRAAQSEKDKAAAAAQKKMLNIRKELDQANNELGETDG